MGEGEVVNKTLLNFERTDLGDRKVRKYLENIRQERYEELYSG